MTILPSPDPQAKPDPLFLTMRAGYQALGELLDKHRDYLLKIIHEEMDQRVGARHGESDIVQDAFVNVLCNIKSATDGFFAMRVDEDLKTWLRRVAINALLKKQRDERCDKRDYHRDQTAPEGLDPATNSPGPSSIYRRKERSEVLEQAVNALPEADRLLLRLREEHRWDYADLAELLEGQRSDAGRMRMKRRLTEILFRLRGDGSISSLID